LYVPVSGNETFTASPYYNAQGIMGFPSPPGQGGTTMNGWSGQWSPLLAASTRFVDPRGMALVGDPISTVWIADYSVGLYRFSLGAGGVWSSIGPFTITNETAYTGVSLSADGSTVYVGGNRGIYGFSNATMGWLNGGALLVTSPSSGAGLSAIYRGLALSPAQPSPTPSLTPSSSQSATASLTPSNSATSTSSLSSGGTASQTATQSGTPSHTPTQTPTASQTATSSATPSHTATPSSSDTPSGTPSPSVTPSSQGPLSYGSMIVARLGDGTTAANTSTKLVPMFLEEWAMPTAGSSGSAYIRQVIQLDNTCTAVPVSAATTQGFLSVAADRSHVAFSCYYSAAGGNKPSTVQIGQIFASGASQLWAVSLQGSNAAYEVGYNEFTKLRRMLMAAFRCLPCTA
jgi:hypothetical protein